MAEPQTLEVQASTKWPFALGEMAERIRAFEWAATPLGPIEEWRPSLRVAVDIMLGCAFPATLQWGSGLLLFYNDAYISMIGDRHPLALGRPILETFPEIASFYQPFTDKVRKGERIVLKDQHFRYARRDQPEDLWFDLSYSPVHDPDGSVIAVYAIGLETTQRRRAELARAAADMRVRRMMETEGVGMIIFDGSAGVVADANEVFLRMVGYSREEMESRQLTWRKLTPPEWTAISEEQMIRFQETGRIGPYEKEYFRKDGTRRWMLFAGRDLGDGTICEYAIDITDRKHAEESRLAEQQLAEKMIRTAHEQLHAVFHTTLEYIGLLSTDGKVHDTNRPSLEFCKMRREDVVGQYFWETPWFARTPGMPEWVKAAVERGAAGEPSRKEMALVTPSGKVVHFDFSLTPVFNDEGRVIWLVPESRDVSEVKRAEQALLQSEKLAAVGRLATSIAHEINNPLEAVTNLLYLARQSRSLEQVADCLKSADHELRRVSTIANQTLRFHRQAMNPMPMSAADLMGTVLSIYEGRLRNSNIAVKLSYRTGQPVTCFDGDIRQVLNNLVGNAIDAMSRRGGNLLVRSHATHDWKSERPGIVITIADNGAGIAKENLGRIFEPFFTTKGIGGTGLGLWICQEVAARHQGTIRVRSSNAPHRSGTVFRFFLPFESSGEKKMPAMVSAEV